MISIVHNETQKAVEMHLDHKGIDMLIQKLQELKLDGDHIHLYASKDDSGLALKSPYCESLVFGQLILNLLPSEAWTDAEA